MQTFGAYHIKLYEVVFYLYLVKNVFANIWHNFCMCVYTHKNIQDSVTLNDDCQFHILIRSSDQYLKLTVTTKC